MVLARPAEQLAAAYADVGRRAQAVLRGLSMLDLDAVSVSGAAAMLGCSAARARAAMSQLAANAWLDPTDGLRLRPDGRRWLATWRSQLDEAEVETMALNLARDLLDAITTATNTHDTSETDHTDETDDGRQLRILDFVADRRHEVIAALRTTLRIGEPRLAVRLALAAWSVASNVIDPTWRHDLARYGEEAAIISRQPAALMDLLVRSAEVYSHADDRTSAERQWVRALGVADDINDRPRFAELLLVLSQHYRQWGRLHKALDVLEELVAERERTSSSPSELAEALTAVGITMLDAGRPESASIYLSRADTVIQQR